MPLASSMSQAVDHLIGQLRRKEPETPPDCLCRVLVTKHSWRGKYTRVLCITPSAVVTQHPDNLAGTNTYVFTGESDLDAVSVSASDAAEDQEFALMARQDRKVRRSCCPHLLTLQTSSHL